MPILRGGEVDSRVATDRNFGVPDAKGEADGNLRNGLVDRWGLVAAQGRQGDSDSGDRGRQLQRFFREGENRCKNHEGSGIAGVGVVCGNE